MIIARAVTGLAVRKYMQVMWLMRFKVPRNEFQPGGLVMSDSAARRSKNAVPSDLSDRLNLLRLQSLRAARGRELHPLVLLETAETV